MKFTSIFLQRVQSILFKDSASRVIKKQACLIFLSELSCKREQWANLFANCRVQPIVDAVNCSLSYQKIVTNEQEK